MKRYISQLQAELPTIIAFAKSPTGALLIGLVGVVLAIYPLVASEKKSELSMAIALSSDVVTRDRLSAPIELTFAGRRIDLDKENLKIVFVRFWNSGANTIRPVDYDPAAPLGFAIDNAQILLSAVDRAPNKYLTDTFRLSQSGSSALFFNPVVLEPGDVLFFKLVVLQNKPAELDLRPVGKVAGVPEVQVLDAIRQGPGEGYIKEFVPKSGFYLPATLKVAVLGVALAQLLILLTSAYRKFKASHAVAKEPEGSPTADA